MSKLFLALCFLVMSIQLRKKKWGRACESAVILKEERGHL